MTAAASPTPLDRAAAAFRALVRAFGIITADSPLALTCVHEYAVTSSDGATFTGNPTDPTFSPPLPVGVPYAPALAGSTCIVPAGTLAYVGFANADPAKPFMIRFGAGSMATSTAINGTASSPKAARAGDFVVRLGLGAGGVPSYSVSTSSPYTWNAIPSGSGPGGALLPTDAGVAINITGGSGKVTIG